MTAKEIIFKAQEVTENSSMLEIAQAEKNLSMLADIVAGGNLEVAWKIARDIVKAAKEKQNINAQNGKLITIIG